MNYIDIIILVPCLWFAFKGFKNGFFKEIASLGALIIGLWLAVSFSDFLAGVIQGETDFVKDSYIPIVSFVVIFIGVVVLVHLLSKALDKLIKAIALGWLNKMAGMVFGLAKAILILAGLLFIINQFLIVKSAILPPQIVHESFLYQPLMDIIDYLYPHIENIKFQNIHL
jgi:membrane protein required for colicin V production